MTTYTDWRHIPTNEDMISYADYYKDTVSKINGKYFAELGIRDGVSTRIIMDALGDADYRLYLVDIDKRPLVEELLVDSRVEFFHGKAEDAITHFRNRSLSFLHIDLDPHSFDQTKVIFELYEPKIKKGGIVMFHDCTPQWGVFTFVNEILLKDRDWKVEFCSPGEIFPHTAPARATRLK